MLFIALSVHNSNRLTISVLQNFCDILDTVKCFCILNRKELRSYTNDYESRVPLDNWVKMVFGMDEQS